MQKIRKSQAPAGGDTLKEIRELLGTADTKTVHAVRALGALREEIVQAKKWSSDPEYMASSGLQLNPRARKVCNLLAADREALKRLYS